MTAPREAVQFPNFCVNPNQAARGSDVAVALVDFTNTTAFAPLPAVGWKYTVVWSTPELST